MGNSGSAQVPYTQQDQDVESSIIDHEERDSNNTASNEDANRNSAEENNTRNNSNNDSNREEDGGEDQGNRDPTGGVYFGTHFILGGQRILDNAYAYNTDVLFGRARDDYHMSRNTHHPSRIHSAPTVKSAVNLHKDTLKLIRDGDEYKVQFNFDATEECIIKVFFVAKDQEDAKTHEISSMQFPCGLNQTYLLPDSINLASHSIESLTYQPNEDKYPLSIKIETVKDGKKEVGEKEGASSAAMIESQTTFSNFLLNSEVYEVKPMKVSLNYAGASYVVHDLYGNETTSGDLDCVICMTDPRSITVWPCNHMCLCHACAELFRFQTDKCPICRAAVKALLKIDDPYAEKKKDSLSSQQDDEDIAKETV